MNEQNGFVAYEFGDFRADILKRQLRRDGVALQLTAKAFDTLAALIANHGVTLTKTELMNSVWGETAVEENNLTQQISTLRRALGERAGDHKFIVTVPGSGYCFVAPVRGIRADREHELTIHPSHSGRTVNRSSLFGIALALAYILIVCLPLIVTGGRGSALKPHTIAV